MKAFYLIVVGLLLTGVARGEESAISVLERMSMAMKNQNYRGRFVYLQDGNMESMEIVHRKDQHGQIEKIISLNGEAREVIRNGDGVKCIYPNIKKITIDKSHLRSQLPLTLPKDLSEIERFYNIKIVGEERIAGRQAILLSIMPQDGYRYGHRLSIDKANFLMLKSELLDGQGVSIEQIMFTDLNVVPDLSDQVFTSRLDLSDFNHVELSGRQVTDHSEREALRWRVARMPQGFALVSHKRDKSVLPDTWVEHMVISDGLASVSVFIEPLEPGGKVLKGISRVGAANAYSSTKHGHKITVVGEVPAASVMLINQYTEYNDD